MKKRWKFRIWLCLCLVAAALMIPGIYLAFASGGKTTWNKDAEAEGNADIQTEVKLEENNAELASFGGKTVLFAAKDAVSVTDDVDDTEAGKETVIEEDENILLTDTGKYTGAQVVVVKTHHVNVTDQKINYLKKTYTNTSNGSTTEILNTVSRCYSFSSYFVGIGEYAFAGANNPNPSYATTMQTRINSYLKEVAFEAGSSMVSIEKYAFSNDAALEAFDGTNATKLTTLGDYVFYNDRVLKLIVLPSGITSVGADTFTTNNASTKVVVPEGSKTDSLFQGSYVFNLPGNVYYTYSGVDPSDYKLKTFDLSLSGSDYDAKVYVNGSEIATYTGIAVGSKVKVNLQPKTGYQFKAEPTSSITAATSGYSCSASGSGYEIEFIMTKDATITLSTEILQYSLTVKVTDNVSGGTTKVTASGKDTEIGSSSWDKKYDYGTKLSVSFSPASHYYLGSITLDNVKKDGNTSLDITMDQDHEVTVSYLPNKYTLSTIFDSSKGSITGNEGSYTYGTTASLTIEPKVGYEISEILVNGSNVSVTTNLKLSLEENSSVQAIFEKKMYSIDTAGENVTITNNTSGVFEYGTDVTLQFTPSEGYRISDVLIDGKSVGIVSSYLLSGLNADHQVEVCTERITFQITVNADEHTLVSNEPITVASEGENDGADEQEKEDMEETEKSEDAGEDEQTDSLKTVYYYGETPEFYFLAMEGYVITDILLDGASLGARGSYCFPELRKDHTLTILAEEIKIEEPAEGDVGNGGEGENDTGDGNGDASGNGTGGSSGGSGDASGAGGTDGSNGSGDNGNSGNGVSDGSVSGNGSGVSGNGVSDGSVSGNRASDGSVSGNGSGVSGNGVSDGSVSGNRASDGSVSGNGSDVSGNSVSGNGASDGSVSGNGSDVSGNSVSGNGASDGSVSGNGSGVSGNSVSGNGASDESVSGNESGTNTGGSLQDKLDNQYPDKTGYEVDDEGNVIDKTASVIKLEFDSSGGMLKYDYLLYHAGATFQLPVPIRYGYDFAGWYLGGKKVETTKGIISQTDKLVAYWTPAVYRITYDLKGGYFKNTSKVAYLYTITKSTSLVKPAREGYVFAGWYLKGTDIKVKKIKKGWYYGGTLELEAKWYIKNSGGYSVSNNSANTGGKITYDLAGGYFNDVSQVQEYYAFMSNTTLPKPVRTGYVFEGWYIEGTEVRLTKISKNQYLGELKLVAAWSRSHYTITYCVNKGKGKQDKTTLVYDDPALISASQMTRSGYVFSGWNTKSNGTGISYQPGDEVKNLTLKSNIKLYAQWQKLF